MAIITTFLEQNNKVSKKYLSWLVVLTGGLLFFYEFMQMNMFNSLSAPLMATFHINAAKLGLLSAVYFYTNAGLLFFAGNLLDRFSTRKLILIAMLLCSLGTLGFALASSFMIAVIFRFVVGIGGSFCFLSAVKLASRWFLPHRMGVAIGAVVTMAMIGGSIAQAPLTVLIHFVGWRYALLLDGLLGLLLILLIWAIVKDYPRDNKHLIKVDQAQVQKLGLKNSIIKVLSNVQNWLGAFYTCFMNIPLFLLGAFIGSIYLRQMDHLALNKAASVSGMIYIGTIFGSPIMGWISDYLKRRRLPMIVGSVVALAVSLVLMVVPNLSYASLLFIFFIIGFISSMQVIGYPTVAEHNDKVLTGTAVSIVSMVTVFSGGVLMPFAGWLLDVSDKYIIVNGVPHYSLHAYHNVMLIIPAAFTIGLIAALLIKETHCKQQS